MASSSCGYRTALRLSESLARIGSGNVRQGRELLEAADCFENVRDQLHSV